VLYNLLNACVPNVEARRKTPFEINFLYLGNKGLYCILIPAAYLFYFAQNAVHSIALSLSVQIVPLPFNMRLNLNIKPCPLKFYLAQENLSLTLKLDRNNFPNLVPTKGTLTVRTREDHSERFDYVFSLSSLTAFERNSFCHKHVHKFNQ